MPYEQMFGFLVCAAMPTPATLSSARLDRIVGELARLGYATTRTATPEYAMSAVRSDASIGCVLIEWSSAETEADVESFVRFVRERGLEMPVFVIVERHLLQEVPVSVLGLVTGYVFIEEDTPEFVARNLASHLRDYAESLKTPFFGAMVDYADEANQMWTCPGHNGGVFYQKSPVGRAFVKHLGEAVFRNDLDNSVTELGDLLVHEGPALAAQKAAARIFGAERTYFVLNGTSTSNKIVLSALIAPGDLVLFDRNNHKAAHHGALLLGGGIPVYLPASRNAQGLIGPIDADALDETRIRESIRRHPLVADPEAWRRARPFRAAVIEQCTYDGTIYSAEQIVEKLGPLCEYIVFDEAWAGFMKFHPLFKGRYAMGVTNLGPDAPGIIATQSTHKQLAGFSQASQIHVKDSHLEGQKRRVGHRRFNEMFMQHSSTSPFYPLFASLDVGAQMMKGRSGEVLWDDTIKLGIELRKKLRALRHEFEASARDARERWFFEPFVPDLVEVRGRSERWEDVPTELLASDAHYWALEPNGAWHGFAHLAPGYAMTDPNKLTLLTPGFDRATGEYADHGIPASVLAQYLHERRIVPEKNDLNSILFLLTPGLESSKAGTLLSALVGFKRLHDANAPLDEAMPEFVAAHRARYAGIGLRDLCAQMHRFYREHDVSRLQRDQFRASHFPQPAMTPQAAMHALVRNEVELLPVEEIRGRIAATLALVYPPGIGVVVPGERYDERAQPMLDYFRMFEEAGNLFPGFENEIQGIYRKTGDDGRVRLHTYVVIE
ncbi:Orn/Lys/Arg decarboxylase N-terminal domain-containing protein [Trinickia caryophylli]|uniref:Ornithine decarboxylase n=2 Tax=Trinickia caryophylli TaxID=28094 RepID=A0A1X7F9J6_TRICW|nr:Orn/Lys/Arg decarboxylase N-terminal domain-containing protein [Trinickia caryophylli]PMS08913.1 amino acid decarboxylase [Trinickia caryophylli]WQE10207.1 Orn/Lys/Arg decarboxylase N-terminal domain-containing protein [Trinickia caryophylli]GLU34353.1 amino acid decarboxylase [Trinickia caryophylli]SMF47857.1 ornithine decarboxylase [Trinickia caryophylli]